MGVTGQTNTEGNHAGSAVVIRLWILLLCVMGLWLCRSYQVRAEEQLYFDAEGNLHMTTHDRIATSNITYKTIGWRMKRYNLPRDTPGNDSIVVVMDDNGTSWPDPDNPAYQYCSFVCDKESICQRIGEASAQWQEELYRNGGYVYFDAFMTICDSGVPRGGLLDGGNSAWGYVYDMFETISTAEPWHDPEALRSHYDKQVYFGGNAELLVPECAYEITQYECGSPGEPFLPLSRYGRDSRGTLIGAQERLEVYPEDFSGYDFSYVSACVRATDRDGNVTETWTEEVPVTVANAWGNLVSVSVSLYYKRESRVSSVTDSFHLRDGMVVMDAAISIGAGNRDEQKFDVSAGVPTGEDLYVDGSIYPFGYQVTYENHYGYQTMPVTLYTVYTGHWTEPDGTERTEQLFCPETYYVDRPYSYWCITQAEIHTLEEVRIENEVFEGGEVLFSGEYQPDIVLEQKNSHIRNPNEAFYWVDGGLLEGGSARPDMPLGSRQADANLLAAYYMVTNDTFSIDGEVFLSGNETGSQGGSPKCGSDCGAHQLYREELTIPVRRKNGRDYQSSATASYRAYAGGALQRQEIEDVNAVTLHTPVVCHAFATDEKEYNQLCQPDEGCYSWILGRDFEIHVSSMGQHLEQPGYGEQDYSRYALGCEVQFPFAVYKGQTRYEAGSWIDLTEGGMFYLPTGVKEGIYRVLVRCRAYNWDEERTDMELYANLGIEHDTAYDEMKVQVCGRLYGMCITDVLREEWKPVFYQEDGTGTGYCYPVGLHNMNGEQVRRNPFATCPILSGGYPYDEEQEGEPLGTAFTYELESVGDYREDEGVCVEPEFYVTDKQGGNRRRVELYHFYDDEGGWENVLSHEESGVQYLTACARKDTGDVVRNVSDAAVAAASVQHWRSNFQIPEELYVVAYGTDMEQYIRERGSISIGDTVFIRDGYLIIRFVVHTKKGDKFHLSYTNEEHAVRGYANMWEIEGFANPKKKSDGTEFALQYGDVFVYDLSRRISQEHRIMGTH